MSNENRIPDYDFSRLSEPFKDFIGSPEQMFQFLDIFPMPIEVFTADGTTAFCNKFGMNFFNIKDTSVLVGKYNTLHDPAVDASFGREKMERAFKGEFVSWVDLSVPIQSVVDQGRAEEKPFEAAFMDVYAMPVWDDERLSKVIFIFNLNRMYQGIPEVAAAKEYIDSHWLDKFDARAVAKAVNVSYSTMAHLFKQHAGMTLQDYYQQVKVEHIKDKLADKSLTVAEAFSFCGEDSRGAIAKTFKNLTGMTPTEYKDSLK